MINKKGSKILYSKYVKADKLSLKMCCIIHDYAQHECHENISSAQSAVVHHKSRIVKFFCIQSTATTNISEKK